jgi:type IV secretory pathway VirB4 component
MNLPVALPAPFWFTVLGLVGSTASAACAAALLVPRVRDRALPRPVKKHLADYIPLVESLTIETAGANGTRQHKNVAIRCRNGAHVAVLELAGRDAAFLTDDEQRGLYHLVKQLLDGAAEEGLRLRYVLLRRPSMAREEPDLRTPLANEIAGRWNARTTCGWRNTLALLLEVSGGKDALARLLEQVERTQTLLRPFCPTLLTSTAQDSVGGDLTLEGFFGALVAPLTRPNPARAAPCLARALAVDEVEFEAPDLPVGWFRFWHGEDSKLGCVLSICDFGQEMRARLIEELMTVDAELTIVQSAVPVRKAAATARIYAKSTADLSAYLRPSIAGQYATTLNMIGADDEEAGTLIEYAMVVIVYGATAETLVRHRQNVEATLVQNGARPKRERSLAPACWFNQIPTAEPWPRALELSSWNVANLLSFAAPPAGAETSVLDKRRQPDGRWIDGPPTGAIAYIPTAQGTLFAAQYHERAGSNAGHSITIGDTNAGKTTWAQFMALLSSRHTGLSTYVFDRLHGMYAFTSCVEQIYVQFGGERLAGAVQGGLNPLHVIDTDHGLEAVQRWLEDVAHVEDATAIDEVANALLIARLVPREERSLATLLPMMFGAHGQVRRELQKWIDPRRYGGLVNAQQEVIGLEGAWLTTFDMSEIGADDELAPAILSYLIQRCLWHMRDTGCRAHFLLDEMPALIRVARMPETIGMLLREIRKAGGFVSLLCQTPRDLTGEFGSLVRSQCKTQWIYPNPNASEEDWRAAGIDLNEKELRFLQGRSPLNHQVRRGVLLRRPGQRMSVVLDVDLSCLGQRLLKVFSSDAEDVRFLAELQAQFGRDIAIERYVGMS